jgi:hypothetical protein
VKDQTQSNPVLNQLLVGNKLHDDVPGVARWPIIWGVNQARQRALACGVGALVLLLMGSACQARSSVEAAQTAIVAAQTVLPGAQATAQAGATLVSIAVANAQPVAATLQALLQGVSVQIKATPADAQPDAVTDLAIEGTDVQGTLSGVDVRARQAAAAAALVAAQQYYPKASISLRVTDGSGGTLLSGSVAPGAAPDVQ